MDENIAPIRRHSRWAHYQGDIVVVTGCAKLASDGTLLVLYVSEKNPNELPTAMPTREFVERIEIEKRTYSGPRFVELK